MSVQAVHTNLDTSFVNLSALIKYLRRRQFSGTVKIQLNGYCAKVVLGDNGSVNVQERDEISGKTAEGKEALQRLLIRAREPGGTISVFSTESKTTETAPIKNRTAPVETTPTGSVETREGEIPMPATPPDPIPVPAVEAKVITRPSTTATIDAETVVKPAPSVQPVRKDLVPTESTETSAASVGTGGLPDFPFRLSNRFEEKARQSMPSEKDWQNLLKLTVELLTVVDRSIAPANLNFSAELGKVCSEIAGDYPFLKPSAELFSYSNGKLAMRKQVNHRMFMSGVAEALRKILLKLSRSGRYSNTYIETCNRLQTLIQKRSPVYERLSISSQIRRIVSP